MCALFIFLKDCIFPWTNLGAPPHCVSPTIILRLSGSAIHVFIILHQLTHSHSMPICNCGCNQILSNQAIQKHRQAGPHLVSAAAQAFQTLGPVVSPPHLNPSKKLQTSQRYFPSSLEPALPDWEMNHPTSEADDGCMDVGPEDGAVDIDVAQHAIDSTLADVWSGQHHSMSDNDEGDEDDGGDEDSDLDSGGDGGLGPDEGWKLYDELMECEGEDVANNSYDLSAMDMLRENYECNAIGNGMPSLIYHFADI